ncbi:MAG: inositol monophosphatase family protein [archaeon]
MKENLKIILLDALKASHKTATTLTKDAGTYLTKGYSGDISTRADINIEQAVIDSLNASGISAKIISEESGTITINTTTDPRYLITIDPLDGSSNFSHGESMMPYSTTIAILSTAVCPRFRDIICAGTIEHTKNNTWLAKKGEGTTLNNTRCSPSKKKEIDNRGKYIVDFFYETNWTTFRKLLSGKEKININDYGSAALHYAMLASGHIDAMLNATQKAHELGPGYLIVKESGATITDPDGNPLDDQIYDSNKKYPVIAASTTELHKEIRETIKK